MAFCFIQFARILFCLYLFSYSLILCFPGTLCKLFHLILKNIVAGIMATCFAERKTEAQ